MTRSVTFNGITQFKPGGLSAVDASALAQIGLSSNGIVGLIGEADGGVPGEITQIDDPALAKSTYRSGPLADAIRLAFDPTDDPRVPGGAFRCLCIKTNQSTQSTLVLYQEVGDDVDAGASTTVQVNITPASLTANEHVGNFVRVRFATGLVETRPITSNTTGALITTTAFTVAPLAGDVVEILAPQMTVTTRDYGVHTAQTLFEFESGVSLGSHWTTSLDGKNQLSGDVGGKSYIEVEYVGNSTQFVHAAKAAVSLGAGSTTTLEDTAGAFLTAGDGLDRYFVLAGTEDNLDVANLRKIVSNSAIELTVTNAFWSAAGAPLNPWAAGGTVYAVRSGEILSFGVAAGVDSGATAAWAAGSVTMANDLSLALNELASMILVVTAGTGAGQKRTIMGNTAGVSSVISINENWVTIPDATSSFEVRYTTLADATVAGAAGVASGFSTRKTENQATTPVADLAITITATMTLSDLVATIDANPSYAAWVTSGANGNLLASTLDFGGIETAGVPDGSNAQFVDLRNDRNAVTTPPSGSTDPVDQWPNHFRRDLEEIVDSINSISELLLCTKSTGAGTGSGSSRPEFQAGTAATAGETTGEYLTGGTLGGSTNTTWQTAFDLMLQERMQHIVPLIVEDLVTPSTATYASVAAQLASHVSTAAGAGKNEQGGYIGYKGNLTGYVARLNAYNNTDVAVTSQTAQVLDVDGNLATMAEWSSAVIAAGMRAGMGEVGEPLTHKYFRTSLLAQDASWEPADITDANLLIQNGALFAETIEGKGTRWVRDLTSYIQDDNLAFAEGSVRDVVRYTSYELRTFLEDRFTGVKSTPATVTSIKQGASEELEVLRSGNVIVDSTNDAGQLVRAYHNLRVTIGGDIARIRVSVFPAVGINFQLTELFLQLPTQSSQSV